MGHSEGLPFQQVVVSTIDWDDEGETKEGDAEASTSEVDGLTDLALKVVATAGYYRNVTQQSGSVDGVPK